MPYTTDRGVTSYYDRDTPLEYASGQDEDAARFNDARDRSCATAEKIYAALDELYGEPIPAKAGEMGEIADALVALLVRARHLAGGSPA